MKRQVVISPDTKMVRTGGRPSRAVIILLAVQLGFFLLYAFADGPRWVNEHLALSSGRALGLFELWQPLTAPWFHLHGQPLILNLVALWFFGPPLERWWGTRRLVVFWILTGIIGMLVALPFGLLWPLVPVGGSSGAAAALMVAFAVLFPAHLVYCYGVWPLKARWLGLLLVAFILIGNIVGGAYLEMAVQLGGVVGGLLLLFSPRRWLAELRLRRAKRKFGVIEGGKKPDDPKYLN